ncbi:MAG: hypothetical protein WCT04_22285 [Planctomycetota bacterium]
MDSDQSLLTKSIWTPWARRIALVLLLLYFGFVYRGVMFTTDGVTERDGFYHARYSHMLPERGLSRELPWMQFADWKDHFCDKDFLYHIYLAPFTTDAAEPLPGAKYGTLLLLLATLGVMYWILRKWDVPFALLWVAFAGVGSAHFLNRMFMIRSHCLSVLLMLLATHIILKRRFWPCFALAFIYAWSYSFPVAMLLSACACETGRVIIDRDWKAAARMPLATAAGLLAGLAIHPYSPYSLKSVWMLAEIARSGVAGSPLELGTEFRHMSLGAAFTVSIGSSLAVLAALVGGVLLLSGKVFESKKLAPETAALIALATAWFLASLLTFERFIEYAAPLAFLALGFVIRDIAAPIERFYDLSETRRMALFATLFIAVCCATGLHAWTLELNRASYETNAKPALPPRGFARTEQDVKAWFRGRFFDGAAHWMRTNLKPGTVVANFYWTDFPELFYSAPEMRYLVGLDPTLMRLQHPDKALALEAMRIKEFPDGRSMLGERPIDFAELKNLFNTDYTIMRRSFALKYPDLCDASLKKLKTETQHGVIVYQDTESVIYFYKK